MPRMTSNLAGGDENKEEPEMPGVEDKPGPDMPRTTEHKAEEHGYDVRILINTLTQLVDKGSWSVEMAKTENSKHFKPTSTEKAVYLSVHGRELRGKTFLLSQISEELFTSERERTKGISLRHIPLEDDSSPEKCPSLLLLDTAGTNAPFRLTDKLDRLATDCFMRELVHKISHINVVVVGCLDLDDQRYLDELATKRNHEKQTRKSAFGEVLVVHNFQALETVGQVEAQIQRDIVEAFNAQSEGGGIWYKCDNFSHYVLAKNESDAGKKYNKKTIQLLRSNAWVLPSKEVHQVFGEIERVANQLLPIYLMLKEQAAQIHSAKITINGTIDQNIDQTFVCKFTGRELRMDETVQLKFESSADAHALKLITTKGVQLSTFLQPGRLSASFLESSVFEPKIDVTITGEHVNVTLDAPGCQVHQEVQGAVLILTGNRTVVNGNTLAERPSGNFTITLTFPSNWNLSSQKELINNGVYHLTISRTARGVTSSLPRVTKVPIGESDFLEVIETKDETNGPRGTVSEGRELNIPPTALVVQQKKFNAFVVYPNPPHPTAKPIPHKAVLSIPIAALIFFLFRRYLGKWNIFQRLLSFF